MISKLLLASALSLSLATGAVAQTSGGGSGGQSGTSSSGTTGSGSTGSGMTGSGSTGSGTASGTTGSVSGGATSSGGTSSGTQRTTGDDCINASPNQNQRDANPSASAPTACN